MFKIRFYSNKNYLVFSNYLNENLKVLNCLGLGDFVPDDSDSIDVFQSVSSLQESPRENIIHIIDEDCEKGHWQVGQNTVIRLSYHSLPTYQTMFCPSPTGFFWNCLCDDLHYWSVSERFLSISPNYNWLWQVMWHKNY